MNRCYYNCIHFPLKTENLSCRYLQLFIWLNDVLNKKVRLLIYQVLGLDIDRYDISLYQQVLTRHVYHRIGPALVDTPVYQCIRQEEGTWSVIRDWSLITGRGGATKREGGAREVYPYEKGGGAEKVLAILKGGHTKFWGCFYAVA